METKIELKVSLQMSDDANVALYQLGVDRVK